MGMVFTYVNGRCGNQLFYYAISRAIDEKYAQGRSKLVFDFRQVNKLHTKTGDGFEDSLCAFQTKEYTKVDESLLKVVFKTGDVFQKFWYFVYSLAYRVIKDKRSDIFLVLQRIMWKQGLFILHPFHVKALKELQLPKKLHKKNYYVAGPFEKSSLFNDCRDVLLKEICSKDKVRVNEELYNTICSTNSVCVSIRRGDYEADPQIKKRFSICDKTYYEDAIKEFRDRIADPVFVIFSDDVEWAKKNLDIEGEVYYESGHDPVWEKLRLMSGCKHFVISNSTFSWWAQWLSQNDNKLVISPDIWYRPDIVWPLLEDSFIKINVSG